VEVILKGRGIGIWKAVSLEDFLAFVFLFELI
jgi:DNA-binding protein